ncbi:MAG: DUF423 domain-containing protein [Chloroflexi bacterium]|nr:DUF423 domain-containing protein [Chloroflexota bacterium]
MDRFFFVLGSLLAFLAVAAGAFGAHGLRARLAPELLDTFETAARYHFYHALGLLAVAWAVRATPAQPAQAFIVWAGWLFLAGTLLFSGSLYLLSLTGLRWLGAITPFGGLAFLLGWLSLAWAAWRG